MDDLKDDLKEKVDFFPEDFDMDPLFSEEDLNAFESLVAPLSQQPDIPPSTNESLSHSLSHHVHVGTARKRGKMSKKEIVEICLSFIEHSTDTRLSSLYSEIKKKHEGCKKLKISDVNNALIDAVSSGVLFCPEEPSQRRLLPLHFRSLEGGEQAPQYDLIFQLNPKVPPLDRPDRPDRPVHNHVLFQYPPIPHVPPGQFTTATEIASLPFSRQVDFRFAHELLGPVVCKGVDGSMIRQFNTREEITQAGLGIDAVLSCLTGKQSSAFGMTWSYVAPAINGANNSIRRSQQLQGKAEGSKAVGRPRGKATSAWSDEEVEPASEDDFAETHCSDEDVEELGERAFGRAENRVHGLATDPLLFLVFSFLRQGSTEDDVAGAFLDLNSVVAYVQSLFPMYTKHSVVVMLKKGVLAGLFLESYRPSGPTASTTKAGRGFGRRAHAFLYYRISTEFVSNYRIGVELRCLNSVLHRFLDFAYVQSILAVSIADVFESVAGNNPKWLGNLSFHVFVESASSPLVEYLSLEETGDIVNEIRPNNTGYYSAQRNAVCSNQLSQALGINVGLNGKRCAPWYMPLKPDRPDRAEALSADSHTSDQDPALAPDIGPNYQAEIPVTLGAEHIDGDVSEVSTQIKFNSFDVPGMEDFLWHCKLLQLRIGQIFIVHGSFCEPPLSTTGLLSQMAFGVVVEEIPAGVGRGQDVFVSASDGRETFKAPLAHILFDESIFVDTWNKCNGNMDFALEQVQQVTSRIRNKPWEDVEIRTYFRLTSRMLFDQRNKFPHLFRISSLAATRSVYEVIDFHFRFLSLSSRLDGLQRVLSLMRCARCHRDGPSLLNIISAHSFGPKSTDLILTNSTSINGFEVISESDPSVLNDPWDAYFGVKFTEDTGSQPQLEVLEFSRRNPSDAQASTVNETADADVDSESPRAGRSKRKAVEQFDLETGVVVRRYPSGKAGADSLGISQAYVSTCCRGLKHSAGGFGWRFFEGDSETLDFADPTYVPISVLKDMVALSGKKQDSVSAANLRIKNEPMQSPSGQATVSRRGLVAGQKKKKPVQQLSLSTREVEIEFESAAAAAKHYANIPGLQQRISLCCRGKVTSANGKFWKFRDADDGESGEDDENGSHLVGMATKKRKHSEVATSVEVERGAKRVAAALQNKTFIHVTLEAIMYLQGRRGCVFDAIRAYAMTAYAMLPNQRYYLRSSLKQCVAADLVSVRQSRYTLSAAGVLELRRLNGKNSTELKCHMRVTGLRSIVKDLLSRDNPVHYRVFRAIQSSKQSIGVDGIIQYVCDQVPEWKGDNCEHIGQSTPELAALVEESIAQCIAEGLVVSHDSSNLATKESYRLSPKLCQLVEFDSKLIGCIGDESSEHYIPAAFSDPLGAMSPRSAASDEFSDDEDDLTNCRDDNDPQACNSLSGVHGIAGSTENLEISGDDGVSSDECEVFSANDNGDEN